MLLKVRHGMWFNNFDCAQQTIDGYEIMHMIQKGQMRNVPKNDLLTQCKFVQNLFNV
jgi:hypothetical protein